MRLLLLAAPGYLLGCWLYGIGQKHGQRASDTAYANHLFVTTGHRCPRRCGL